MTAIGEDSTQPVYTADGKAWTYTPGVGWEETPKPPTLADVQAKLGRMRAGDTVGYLTRDEAHVLLQEIARKDEIIQTIAEGQPQRWPLPSDGESVRIYLAGMGQAEPPWQPIGPVDLALVAIRSEHGSPTIPSATVLVRHRRLA